jgi:hypothetical protein
MKSFILRLDVDESGGVTGIVERVRTGAKERFRGYPMLVEIVKRMAGARDDEPARSGLRLRDLRIVVAFLAAVALSGCAGTRVGSFGPLTDGRSLVTLVVSEDEAVVARHCADIAAPRVLGCQISSPATQADGRRVRSIKVVRYTDALPSALAFEIDIHELCHTVASLQAIVDPCHAGNGGVVQAMPTTGATTAGAVER